MKNRYDEDLFAGTTMTFGEHLEDLRGALFRALLGLVVGFAIGLLLGNYVVRGILGPLEGALGNFYSKAALEKYTEWVAARAKRGEPAPYTIDEINRRVLTDELIFDIQYIDTTQVLDELHRVRPEVCGEAQPAASASNSVPSTGSPSSNASVSSETPSTEQPPSDASNSDGGGLVTHPDATAEVAESMADIAAKHRLLPLFLWHPIAEDSRIRAKSFSAPETFGIWIKASLVVGAVISSPWVFYQIWSFVAAGLYPHEKKYVYKLGPFSLGLFLLGAATAYLFVFKPVLGFLFSFNSSMGIDPDPRISEWLSFVLLLPIGFGISFQLPLVMLFLERIGVFDVGVYVSRWRISVLVIFCLSAILTPGGDPYSIFFMAVPLTGLYWLGILLCRLRPKNPNLWDESREEKLGKK